MTLILSFYITQKFVRTLKNKDSLFDLVQE